MPGPDGGVELSRHELRWVLEQAGADRWPYPLRAPTWAAETDTETARHRAHVEGTLRARGLLEPAAARMLLRAGELVAGWRVAVDLVRRDAAAPCAGVALGDGGEAVVLASAEHVDAPVRLVPVPADRMPEAVLALAPPGVAGIGGPWPVPSAGVPALSSGPGPVPVTDRAASVRAAVEEVLAATAATTEVGVATRADPAGPPTRAPALVVWLDGPRGRFAVRHGAPGSSRPPVLAGVNDRQLLGDIHSVLEEATTSTPRVGTIGPRTPTPGRSTA